jgi:hypothetical protein
MSLTKKYRNFFKNDHFYLYQYNNGIASFRCEQVEEGFLVSYEIIVCVLDESLEFIEDEYEKGFSYEIDEIYSISDYVVEINQHDIFTVKSDTLFSNVNRHYEKGF